MKLRYLLSICATLIICAMPTYAQFVQHPDDLGAADTVSMVLSVAPDATTNQLSVQFDLYVFNDSNQYIGATMGFGWDNPNMQMDSAVATPFAAAAFELILSLTEGNDINTTNANQRFLFGGARLFSAGVTGNPTRQQWASYYFSMSSWTASDSLFLDTLTYNSGTTFKVSGPNDIEYSGYWEGATLFRDTSFSQPSNLVISEDTLFFTAEEGGAFPPGQSFDVTSDFDPLAFSLFETAGWLIKSPAAGTTPQTVTISINSTALPAGIYFDSVEVDAPSAANNPQYVYVQLDLQEPPPTLAVSPGSFLFNAIAGESNPPNQIMTIGNTGGSSLSWSVSNSQSWLSLSPLGGTDDETVTLSVDISGLAFDVYYDTIVVTDPFAINSPVSVPVVLNVASDLPIIEVTDEYNVIVVDLPDSTPAPRDFVISNGGGGSMTFDVTTGSPRIALAPLSGSAPETVTASFTLAAQPAGTDILDTVWVTSTEAINSPFPVLFKFHYVDIPAVINASPSTLTFNVYECTDGATSGLPGQTVYVINGGGDNPMVFDLVYESDLFTVDASDFVAPGSFDVTPAILPLPVGVYLDTILVTSDDAINNPDTVFIVYNILEGDQPPQLFLSNSNRIEPIKEDAGPISITAFQVLNFQDGCMDWYLNEDIPWIFVGDTAGTAPSKVKVTLDPTGFPLGEYKDTVFVYSDEATNSPQNFVITMRVWRYNGDVNWDGTIDLSDLVRMVAYLYGSGPGPLPEYIVGDVTCDNTVDISDLTYIVNYLFLGGPFPCGNPFK